jgi:hypothetical protein
VKKVTEPFTLPARGEEKLRSKKFFKENFLPLDGEDICCLPQGERKEKEN